MFFINVHTCLQDIYLTSPLILMDRSTRQKINKEVEDFYNTIHHLHLTDIYRVLNPQEDTGDSQVYMGHFSRQSLY